MATSQNGWQVHENANGLEPLKHITGRVDPKDVHEIFDFLCEWFNKNIEPITVKHSWGWAFRPVRGSGTGYSNHASATAIDLNAPKHPLGVWNTFTPVQRAKIKEFLHDALDDAIRWGGTYTKRPDDMHFEIDCNPAELARVVRSMRKTPEVPNRPAERKVSVASVWVDLRFLAGQTKNAYKKMRLVQARKQLDSLVDIKKWQNVNPVGVPTTRRVVSDLARLAAENVQKEFARKRLWKARSLVRPFAEVKKGHKLHGMDS